MRAANVVWVMLLALLCGGLCEAASFTVGTDDGDGADTYLNYFNAGGNYGGAVALRLSKNYVPYVKFDLSDIGFETVTSANLSFYGAPADVNDLPGYDYADIPVYGLLDGSDAWGETTINYGNAPFVSNPISTYPLLKQVGTLSYTNGTTAVMSLQRSDTALEEFLNNRGPDAAVTFIVGSTKYTPGSFFLTKEYDAGVSAPFLNVTTGGVTESITYWVNPTGGDWDNGANWSDLLTNPGTPAAGDFVGVNVSDGGTVTVDATAEGGRLFLEQGKVAVTAGTLTLDEGVLRISDGAGVDIAGGELRLGSSDQRPLVNAYIEAGKLTTSLPGQEVAASFVTDPNFTIVTTREAKARLQWGSSIVSISGPEGTGGDPAVNCVNGSGIYGDLHARYADNVNSWYARDIIMADGDPVLEIEFDQAYALGDMWVWNYEDGFKGYCLKTVRIETSTDGVTYTTLMDGANPEFVFNIGNKDGTHSDAVPFGGVEAQYVRLTATGGTGVANYQTPGQPVGRFILRELRFYRDDPPLQTLSYPDGGIVQASESHAAWNNAVTYGANRLVDGSGMTGDVHSVDVAGTYWYARDTGVLVEPWALFRFDQVYTLEEMWVWNCDIALTLGDRALKRVKVEYSPLASPDLNDPADWTVLIDGTNPADQWHQAVDGQRSDVVDFAGAAARHVRITPVGGYGEGNYGSTYGYLMNELRFHHSGVYQGFKASLPDPADGAEANTPVTLRWTPGQDAVTGQDVWFGRAGGPLTKIADNIDPAVSEYDLGMLNNLHDYEWRVDGLDGVIPASGDLWSFSTKAWLLWNPEGRGIVEATSSPDVGGAPGVYAVDQSGMNGNLHDPWSWSNGWYCRKPWDVGVTEPELDVTFDRIYALGEMWVWNHHGTSSTEEAIAIKTIELEYSTDGTSYQTLMNGGSTQWILPPGNSDGTHDSVIDFAGAAAKHVRLTAVGGPGVGNYGSSTWGYKLRELRLYYTQAQAADFNGDGVVDVVDVSQMAHDWLQGGKEQCTIAPPADIVDDCWVDLQDLAAMTAAWTEE